MSCTRSIVAGLLLVGTINSSTHTPKPFNPNAPEEYHIPGPDDHIAGTHADGSVADSATVDEIMHRTRTRAVTEPMIQKTLFVDERRALLSNDPQSPEIAFFPEEPAQEQEIEPLDALRSPQKFGVNVLGGTVAESGFFPPDSMGAVGPTQFVVCINGLIKTLRKINGSEDHILDTDLDTFFDSIRNNNFVSDPRIRYDRITNRWFVIAISVTNNFSNNRLLLAVSDSGTITSSTTFNFFYFAVGGGIFLDYPTLGIDRNALYIGGQTFSNNDTGRVYVIQKSSVLGSGPIKVTSFHNVIDPVTGVGPYVPQGCDDITANSAHGYFIGVDNATFGRLIVRRVFNPGTATPTLSGNIMINVPSTHFPISVPHKGNNKGNNGKLDAIDDRLMMACVRNGIIWTVHNVGVDNKGVSTTAHTMSRNGCRWYGLDVRPTAPKVVQVGTLFKASANNTTDQRSYWMPSLMVSGQNHMVLGCSCAGSQEYANAAAAGKLSGDKLGTIQAATVFTHATTAYNPPFDTGAERGARRWGDYSYVSLDPSNNMTMWTIQEYCNAANSWGVRVAQLKAPPPATPIRVTPSEVPQNTAAIDIVITGQKVAGSAFYDPGASFTKRLSIQGTNHANPALPKIHVNSITTVSPTTIKLSISTVGVSPGSYDIAVTNPDGQKKSAASLLTVQ